MPRGARIVYGICAGWLLVMATAAWLHAPRNRLLLGLPLLFFAGAFITSVVLMFTQGERLKDRAVVPLLVCILTAMLAVIIMPRLFEAGFGRIVPRYAAVVRQIERGHVAVGHELIRIPTDAKLAYATWTRRSNEVLTVTFFVGGSFPVRHWGYLYSSSGQIEPGSFEDSQWPKRSKLREKWFYVSD